MFPKVRVEWPIVRMSSGFFLVFFFMARRVRSQGDRAKDGSRSIRRTLSIASGPVGLAGNLEVLST